MIMMITPAHLITTLMLSPSIPDSLPDSPMSLLIDLASEPALPGLKIYEYTYESSNMEAIISVNMQMCIATFLSQEKV